MAISTYGCTKQGSTRIDELHRTANDVVRLTGMANSIADRWADANQARPGDGAGSVHESDGTLVGSFDGETVDSIAKTHQEIRDEVFSWWLEWELAVARLSLAIQIDPPAKLHLDLNPAQSALGRLTELFPRPLFPFIGERPGEHLLRTANSFGVNRNGISSFPGEAATHTRQLLQALVSSLRPLQDLDMSGLMGSFRFKKTGYV